VGVRYTKTCHQVSFNKEEVFVEDRHDQKGASNGFTTLWQKESL